MSESENLAQTLVWNVNTLTRMFHCLEMFLEDVVNFFLYDDVEGWVIASSWQGKQNQFKFTQIKNIC